MTRIDFSDVYEKTKLYLTVGRFEAAEKILLAALREHGPTANIHNLLGVTFHKQSKFGDAIEQFTKALSINKNFIEAGLNLSITYCDLGKYDDARNVFNDLVNQSPKARKQPQLVLGRLANHHAEAGKLYEQTGLINEAIAEYKRALALFDKLPDVRLALAKLFLRTGQFERAVYELKVLIEQSPEHKEGHLWNGIAEWKLNNKETARSHFEAARGMDSDANVAASYIKLVNLQLRTQ